MTSTAPPFTSDAPGGLLVINEEGRILQAPEFFQRALFLDQREVPSIFHLFDPADSPHLVLSKVFRHPYGGIEYHLRVDGLFGTRHGFRYWALPSEEGSDRTTDNRGPWQFFIVDDSALIQTHDWDLRRLRREILSDLKDTLSIHFKNRLATVQLLAETLRDVPDIASESAPRLLRSVAALHRGFNLVTTGIDNLRTTTDHDDTPIRLGDLPSVINTWGKDQVTIDCEMNGVSDATLIPASSIERILFPIVENAVDASSSGSAIQITVTQENSNAARFLVRDAGEGMSERTLQRCQDPFFTTRTGRLGLGLSYAREALRDAGGEWEFHSTLDQGTRFTIVLPVATANEVFGSRADP